MVSAAFVIYLLGTLRAMHFSRTLNLAGSVLALPILKSLR